MQTINKLPNYTITQRLIKDSIVYTDRNWVYYKTRLGKDQIVKDTINRLNTICNNGIKVISNESEDPKSKILVTDKNNWIQINSSNYNLSYEQAVAFIRNNLGFDKCFFVWNETVAKEVAKMWMEIINLWEITSNNYIRPFIQSHNSLPILFARPVFAINARCKNQQEIDNELDWDFSIDAVKLILSNSDSKVVFCHTKPNCPKNDYIELNLWYYFDYLIKEFGLEVGKNIFNVGKWNYSLWEIFDSSLKIYNKDYSKVIGIGDMLSDIKHTLDNWWKGILVLSWDEQITDDLVSILNSYWERVKVLEDLSQLNIQ